MTLEPPLPEGRFELQGRSLRSHMARGALVNAVFDVGLTTLSFLQGALVAVFLTPSEYGVWGVLLITLVTILWLRDAGVSDKFVQQEEDDQERAFQKAFALELLFAVACIGVACVAFPVLAALYGRGELVAPGLVLASSMLWGALRAPVWIFYRRAQFARQRALEAIEPIVSFATTIALAASGVGYWSLVIGVVAGSIVSAAAALVASPYPPRLRYDQGTAREYVGFSWPVLVAAGGGLVMAQGSLILAEHALGIAAVGVIAFAVTITQFANRVEVVITSTLYPMICALRDRTDLLFEAFVKSNRLTLIWGVPFGVGVALFAGEIVEFGVGERWNEAVGVLEVLGVSAALHQLAFNWSAFYRARGHTRPLVVESSASLAVFLALPVPLLLEEGLQAYAFGMLGVAVVSVAVRLVYVRRLFADFGPLHYIAGAFAPTLPGLAAVLVMRAAELERTAATAILELGVFLGLTALATALLAGPLLRESARYLRTGARPVETPS